MKVVEKSCVRHLAHKLPIIRSYCHFHYWKFRKKLTKKEESSLAKGIHDRNSTVARICIYRTADNLSKRCLKAVYKRSDDPDILVRFQALTTIGLRGDLSTSAAATKDKIHMLKLPIIISVRSKRTSRLGISKFLPDVLSDKYPYMRPFYLLDIGGESLLRSMVLRNLKDSNPLNRSAAVIGLANGDQYRHIDTILKMITDPNERVRSSVAYSSVRILGKVNRDEQKRLDKRHTKLLSKFHKELNDFSFATKESAAYAYARLSTHGERRYFMGKLQIEQPHLTQKIFAQNIFDYFKDISCRV